MLLQGRAGDAEQALADVAADRWAAGEPYNALRACYTLSQAQRAQGRLGAALGGLLATIGLRLAARNRALLTNHSESPLVLDRIRGLLAADPRWLPLAR